MSTQQPKGTDYLVQAVVIPRAHDQEREELHVCLAFAVLPPDGAGGAGAGAATRPTVPVTMRRWPTLLDAWLSTANLIVDGQPRRFARWWPRDLQDWSVAQSQRAWLALFPDCFGEADHEPQSASAQAVADFKKVYGTTALQRQVEVNPVSASELNPVNRVEAANPLLIRDGMAAEHLRRVRADSPMARADIDSRYLAALTPGELRAGLTRFARELRREPERFARAVAAALPALVGVAAEGAPNHQLFVAALPQVDRQTIVGEFVAFQLRDAVEQATPEFERVDRLIRTARERPAVNRRRVEHDLKSPTFQQLVARIRQHPGLARRLSLVVHGAVGAPRALQPQGTIALDWTNPATRAINWKKPTTLYDLRDGHFRPRPKDVGSFAPTQPEAFFKSHVYDPSLYRVTQQDVVKAAANVMTEKAESAVRPAVTVQDPDPPPAETAFQKEVTRYQSNAVLFVNAPKLPPAPAGPANPPRPEDARASAAHAVDARLCDSLRSLAPQGNLPDGSLGAEDLMVGVTVFVRRAGAGLPWYSLCRRMVHVTQNGRTVIPAFEEEGFVATGTSLMAPPKVGLVTATVPNRQHLLQLPLFVDTEDHAFVRRQHSELKIKRLMPANTMLTQEETLKLEWPARYYGHFGRFVTADDVYVNDIIHAMLGSGVEYVDIEVVPRLRFFGQPGRAALPLLFVEGATAERTGQRFVVFVAENRTQCLNENGKPLHADSKESCRLFLNELNRPRQANAPAAEFFVEGPRRLWLAGPKFREGQTSSLLQELKLAKIRQAELKDETVVLHKSMPPAVLRRRHLREGDEYRPVPLAAPHAQGFAEGANWLADVREVLTPLTHVRGVVTAIAFDLTVTLQRVAAGAKPRRLFLNILGAPWEIQADGPVVDTPNAGQLSCPKLFAGQVASLVRDSSFAATSLDEARLRVILGGLYRLPAPLPGLTDARLNELEHLQTLWASLYQVPPPAALFAAQALLANSDPGVASLGAAVLGNYYIDNRDGGVALTVNPLLAVALRPADPALGQIRVRLSGRATTGVAANRQRICTLSVTSAQRVPDAPPANSSPSLKWLLSVAQPGVLTPLSVEYDLSVRDAGGKLLSYFDNDLEADKTYLHPLDSHGFLVDCVTDGNGSRLGRAWPQALPGSTWRHAAGNAQATQVFQTADGLFVEPVMPTPRFSGPDGNEVATGYHLVRPIGKGSADSGYLTSGRVTESLPEGGNPNEAYRALLSSVDPAQTSYLLWKAVAPNTPLAVVAEVRKVEAPPSETPRQIELVTLDDRSVTFPLVGNEANTGAEFQPPQQNLPRRRLSDLVAGELVLAYGHLWPDRTFCAPEPGRFVIDTLANTTLLNLSSAVRGNFHLLSSDPSQAPRDSNMARALLRTRAGAEVMIGGSRDELTKVRPGAECLTVVTPVTAADRISLWKNPREVAEEQPHVNALASDVLAKWANWCLTVPMPGEAGDGSDKQAGEQPGPFKICCDRDHRGTDHWAESQVGKWELPPLRFGETYEFLLRRVDFAGNHLYDELLPRDVPPGAVRMIESMVGQTAAARAVLPASLLDENRFLRADLPHLAPLAFPINKEHPAWQTGQRPGEQSTVCRDFRLVAFKREPLLILFSDVLGRTDPVADDAYCFLLPPSAPVETVLMHGVFDRCDPVSIPHVIRCHERYMVQGCLGVDRHGQLNYFGDPQVKKLCFDFVFLQKGTTANAAGTETPAESTVFEDWPRPRPVRLQIAPAPLPADGRVPTNLGPRQPMTAPDVARGCALVHAAEAHLPAVFARMPPGGYGSARVLPVTFDARTRCESAPDIGQRIHLLHVTNGAWIRPRWLALREQPLPGEGESGHKLDGSFEIDAATTGGWTLAGYWNECWDEGQSLGWEEAAVTYPEGPLEAPQSITVADGRKGYGYASEAVVLLTPKGNDAPPSKYPVFEAVLKDHSVEKVELRSIGEGCTLPLNMRVLRRPPLFRIATAVVDRPRDAFGPLHEGEIRLADRGGWYTRPPYVVISDLKGHGYGARATAILNGSGGIARVELQCGGWAYSDEVVIRFYTHQWVQPERTVGLTEPNRVNLDNVWHACGDAKSRHVDYYLTLMPRHAQYLEAAPATRAGAGTAWSPRTMVPRDSLAVPLDLKATAAPSPPNVAFPLLAFHWTYSDGGTQPIADQRHYFRGIKTGSLTVTRTEAIRVYLRRPWHQTGAETLGVVVYPAIANSIRVRGNLSSNDRSVVNRTPDYPNPGGLANALTGDVIPGPLRDVVSRWGFDPIWNERALPPLGPQHFPRALSEVAYEMLGSGTGEVVSTARLALHAVDYDPAKNLWYSDVVVDLKDLGQPLGTHLFIRLNLVTHQQHALGGLKSFAVVATDPIPVTGQRSLRVTRSQPGRFDFLLSGNFAHNPRQPGTFPRRRVIVELQRRDPLLPDEIEVFLRPNQRFVKEQHTILETTLPWSDAEQAYHGHLTLPPATLATLQTEAAGAAQEVDRRGRTHGAHFAVVLKEEEFYRTLSAQPSATGERTVMFDNVACAVRTLTSMSFLL